MSTRCPIIMERSTEVPGRLAVFAAAVGQTSLLLLIQSEKLAFQRSRVEFGLDAAALFFAFLALMSLRIKPSHGGRVAESLLAAALSFFVCEHSIPGASIVGRSSSALSLLTTIAAYRSRWTLRAATVVAAPIAYGTLLVPLRDTVISRTVAPVAMGALTACTWLGSALLLEAALRRYPRLAAAAAAAMLAFQQADFERHEIHSRPSAASPQAHESVIVVVILDSLRYDFSGQLPLLMANEGFPARTYTNARSPGTATGISIPRMLGRKDVIETPPPLPPFRWLLDPPVADHVEAYRREGFLTALISDYPAQVVPKGVGAVFGYTSGRGDESFLRSSWFDLESGSIFFDHHTQRSIVPAHERAQLFFDAAAGTNRTLTIVHVAAPHFPYRTNPYCMARAQGFTPGQDVSADAYRMAVAAAMGELRAILNVVHQARPTAWVAVTSDHGELLGEEGRHFHGGAPMDALVHVPLAIGNARSHSSTVDDTFETSGLLPLLLREALEIPTDPMNAAREEHISASPPPR